MQFAQKAKSIGTPLTLDNVLVKEALKRLLQGSIVQHCSCQTRALYRPTKISSLTICRRHVYPDRSTNPALNTNFVFGTSSPYREKLRATSYVRHVEANVLPAAYGQQPIRQHLQVRELRTNWKSVPPQAKITAHFSILPPWLHRDGYTRNISRNQPRQSIHMRHDDRCFKLTRAILMSETSPTSMADISLHLKVVPLGILTYCLTDSGPRFGSKSFTLLCGYLDVIHLMTTAYHSRSNEEAKRFNHTIVPHLRHDVLEHQRN